MLAFHDSHFSSFATDNFRAHFLCPDQLPDQGITLHEPDDEYFYDAEEYEEEDDDGLGYYPDGAKRTLTDEQIAIFRHSELETLRRVRESTKIKKATVPEAEPDAQLSEGEVSSTSTPPVSLSKKKKKKRKRGKNKPDEEPIDLRKRTWDVVGTGLETLDYGDEKDGVPSGERATQRRRISYDD
ncbi:hypothetical protein OQA88_1538 [Cercophora sp. LCS_1]